MSAKWQRIAIDLPKEYKPNDRVAIATEIMDFIVNRTEEDHKDKNNRQFPRYSKSYAAKKGTGLTSVDLIFTGDMLRALKLLSHKSGQILIGFENGSEQNAKADGNIRGTYGRPSPIPGKARDFLGLTQKDLKAILNSFPIEGE